MRQLHALSAIELGTGFMSCHHTLTDHVLTRNEFMFVPYYAIIQLLQQIFLQVMDYQGKTTAIYKEVKSQIPYPCC